MACLSRNIQYSVPDYLPHHPILNSQSRKNLPGHTITNNQQATTASTCKAPALVRLQILSADSRPGYILVVPHVNAA
jgi:hypothetical protein